MTIHEALFSPIRLPLLGVLYLLLTVQMALLFSAFRDGRTPRFRYTCLLHALLSFVCIWLPFMDIDSNHFRTDAPIQLPAARSAFTALPVWTLFMYEMLTALIVLAAFRNMLRWQKQHPTFDSIKETMDLLPVGIAFARPEGTVVFSNLAANTLCRALTGKVMTDLSTFREGIGAREPAAQFLLPDGSAVWQIVSEPLEVESETFIGMTATDITEQAAITKELEEKNKKLRDIHLRLDIYNKQADRIIIAQELLTARMTVHNELGSVLLESRHYLNEPVDIDEVILLQALKNTNAYLLREYEEDDTARDALTDALETAEAIGVEVKVAGILPEAEPQRGILAAAIIECATNTVKHANGDALSVGIRHTGERLLYTFQNNGLLPKNEISESGGLLSLRSLVEKAGGTMRIDRTPQMELTITLPKMGESAAE